MRLKTLEIKGFKSFADKTVLHFDEGVTGVIGPNGCGKSNIIDSIRWAIGEHKISALRSDKMAGLIFNGSKSRSSSGLAEVSLTFENTRNILPTEYTTVTINRKYFKNGESEYRLNDVVCRLKDIHNLFLDTGISTDSYAIIELGMVDDIIKDKDNSRRRMLEQAAGISIYKTRKKEAKAKLDATEQDLSRIEDLLFEISGNLKTLESQARKAERYYDLKKKYRAVSIELAKASMEGFHLTFKELGNEQSGEENKKAQLETEISRADAEIEANKLLLTEKEQTLKHMQQKFNELVNEMREKENDKKLASQELIHLQEQKQRFQEFLSGADERLIQYRDSLASGSRQLAEEEEKLQEMMQQAENLKKVTEEKREIYLEKKANRESHRNEHQRLQRHHFDIEKKIAVAETSIQNLNQSISRIETESDARQKQIVVLDEEKAVLEEELADLKEEQDQLIRHQEETKENILSSQTDLEALRIQMMEKTRELDSKKNEYDLLKSLVDNLEGYPDSIKFLKKNTSWSSNAPVLSDVIFCREEYRPAVEGLLEPYLNYYVVDNLEEALAAVQLLDKNKKGKANFFLLSHFKDNQNGMAEASNELLPAMHVVETDEKYKGLVKHLLGKVCIAENIEESGEYLENDPGLVIVEKSGKLYRSSYQLGGGSAGLFEGNKLGRAKNLEKLKAAIARLQKEADDLQQRIDQKREEVSGFNDQLNEKKLNENRELVNQKQTQVFGLQNKIENFKHLAESGEKRLLEMQQMLQNSQEQIIDYREELSSFSEQMYAITEVMETAEKEYQEAEHLFNEVNAKFNEHNVQLARQQSKVQVTRQDLNFKQSRLSELQAQIESNSLQLQGTSENILSVNEKIAQTETGLQDLIRRKETEEKTLNESEQEYHNIRNKVNEMESAVRLMQRNKDGIEQTLNRIRESISGLKLQLAGMKERLDVEFKINLDDILDEERTGEEETEALKEKAEKFKKRLENMGEINPTAIDAFQEMKKRYDFILEQKNDLISARDSLKSTIREVEDIANQKFLDTFYQVKENFIKVFKTLFTEEDEADMVLTNPDDLANTNVEIIAKPKGKRPTAITQLSGGEKTLTATALLFAIYLIKPAPFCILDEVDAPLDDANVGKFTNMIRKFSQNSQFIVVTHNKQTMAAVDVIYGVTMQEAGVSKLVPVDFRSLN